MAASRFLASVASASSLLLLIGSLPGSHAQGYRVDSREKILESSRTLASDLMSHYKGNQSGETPGLLPGPPPQGPYYWWEGAALMATMIDYWHLTGDETYNQVVTEGILHQTGRDNNFMPLNQSVSMGNDDQCMWGIAAMLAAENEFPNPPQDRPTWLELATAVWQRMVERYEDQSKECNGGLRWMIFVPSLGYDYKNTISNACLFNLGARLSRYTNNGTYADHGEKAFNWLLNVGFVDPKTWMSYDGAHVDVNCTDINKAQFSYNAAILAQGAAFMFNYTSGSTLWRDRTKGLTDSLLEVFFPDKIAYEVACEEPGTCTTDMRAFKGLVHRWVSVAAQVAPFIAEEVLPIFRESAAAAAKHCTHGTSGRDCAFSWVDGEASGGEVLTGAGEQMSALAAVSSLLITEAGAPVLNSTADGKRDGGPGGGGAPGGGSGNDPNSAVRSGVVVLPLLVCLGVYGWMNL